MKNMKFSTPVAAALVAAFGLTTLAPVSAKADPRHWFYNNYDRYDDRAYYDDDYYDAGPDDYGVYAPPPRRIRPNKRQRRQIRLRRWAEKQARKALRREVRRNRANDRVSYRPERQRLDDAWKKDQYDRYKPPHRDPVKKLHPRKTTRLSYVPLPRTKPYHLIPSNMAAPVAINETVRKFSLDGNSDVAKFDERPVWNATADKKPADKKQIEIAALPKVIAPTPAKTKTTKPVIAKIETVKPKAVQPKTKTTFKPIRIEMVKNPKTAGFRQPRAVKPRLASNQLSCDKVKSIVSGFGFSDITTLTCTGTVYDFNARRDGNPYTIKVSSLSGELKGVKKIK